MGDFLSGINQINQVAGQINGAVNTVAPAVGNLTYSLYQVNSLVNGTYMPDGYYPTYPQPVRPVDLSDPEGTAVGYVGAALAGGAGAGIGVVANAGSFTGVSKAASLAAKVGGGAKAVALAGLKSTGVGAVIGGAVSALEYGFKDGLTGKQKAGHIVADTVGGGVAGAGGALLAGTVGALGAAAMGGILGPVLIVGAGVAGALGSEFLFKKSGLRAWIYDKISGGV